MRDFPTPSAARYGTSQNGVNRTRPSAGTPGLDRIAASWPTPTTERFRTRGGDRAEEPGLDRIARNWSTPTAHDGRRPGVDESGSQDRDLRREVEVDLFPTPMVADSRRTSDKNFGRNPTLCGVARNWATPKTPTGGRELRKSRAARDAGGEDLEAQITLFDEISNDDHETRGGSFSTPTVHDAKGADIPTRTGGPGLSHQIESISNDGQEFRPMLNPAFVEWLMGFPIGWTDFGRLGTAWSRWSRLMRSELSRLESSEREEAATSP